MKERTLVAIQAQGRPSQVFLTFSFFSSLLHGVRFVRSFV